METLYGKVALITGASRGIGRTIAEFYARSGADLVLAARSTEESPHRTLPGTLEDAARRAGERGRRVLTVRADVSREEDVAALAERTLAEFGRCDILVNNAAIALSQPVLETPQKLWDRVMEVNVRGPVMLVKALVPGMIERGAGTVINISSGAASVVGAGRLSYSVSKMALNKLSVGLAEELRGTGVSVNCIELEKEVATEGYMYNQPGRDYSTWEQPEIMGEAALWLATRPASFTGHVLRIDDMRRMGAISSRPRG